MSLLKSLVDDFNQRCPSPCWKTPGHEMLDWAREWELEKQNDGHGLGDLNKPCQPKPGETCPACGITWELK